MAVPEGLSMRCPRCQHENRGGARFCEACGGPLPQTCPECGHRPRLGAAFCDHCGTPLTGTTTAATPPSLAPRPQTPQAYTPTHLAEKILHCRSALEGERKQVTVLFADLKGSMELLADRDPEEARAILDPVLERMMDAVHRYEGTVNQVMGDGIMALFGAPLAHEDHAMRACYAALALQAALRRYSDEVRRMHGLAVDFRVGLNSGEVVVRAIDNDLHMDYSAIGQTVHLAARMEQLATPGSIRLTPATLRLVEGLVQVNALGPIPVRGLTEPVEVFELVSASAGRQRLQAQALFDRLVEALPTARILLLVNYRPEYQHGWGSKTYYTQLRLDPLLPASADELLQALLGGHPSLVPVTPLLIERTEGNPFFLEESVRTLVETGVLIGVPGAYHLGTPLNRLQVPATVQAVLAARIDRLSREDKHLLQCAAVVGTDVALPLLQAIAELPEATLHGGLAHLQAAEFLYEIRLFPEREYTFKHALTHEVAYGTLLQERRRALHARIVEALEALAGERVAEQVERLAHHALRGERWDKALTYFQQAGAKAGSRFAYREAVACFEQALAALQHLPESRDTLEQGIALRISLRTALLPLGEFRRIHDLLRDAATLAEALGDQHRLGRISDRLCHASWQIGDYGAALEFGQRALAISMALGNVDSQLDANVNLAHTYHALGEYGRAIACCRTAVSLEGGLSPPPVGPTGRNDVNSHTRLSQCLAELGAFAEGITHGEEAIRMAEARDHPFSRASAYGSLGDLYLRGGNLHQAITVLERGVELCRIWEIQFYFPHVASPLGVAYALLGRVAEALPLLEQAAEQAGAMGFMPYVSRGLAALSQGYLLAGRMTPCRSPNVPLRLRASARNGAARHGPCASSARSSRSASFRRSSRLKTITVRPSPWPRHSACARSRPTATAALGPCMPRLAGASRRVPSCRSPLSCTRPWT
jgi:class 3 adenylate cyclase/tetratricopeptide (TPR) repeat protein